GMRLLRPYALRQCGKRCPPHCAGRDVFSKVIKHRPRIRLTIRPADARASAVAARLNATLFAPRQSRPRANRTATDGYFKMAPMCVKSPCRFDQAYRAQGHASFKGVCGSDDTASTHLQIASLVASNIAT